MGVLETVLPVVVMVAVGYLFMKKQWIKPEAVDGLKAFVIHITLPCVLFQAFYTASYDRTILVCSGAMFLCCLLGLLTGWLINRLVKRLDKPLLPFMTTGFEAGMLGYALYGMLFGAENLQNFAMLDCGHTLFVFTVYTGLLNARKGLPPKQTVAGILRSPILIAMALGVIAGVSGLGARIDAGPLGGTVRGLLSFVSAPTACVILFVVGYQMRLNAASLKSAIGSLGIRLLVTAGLCALCILLIGLFLPVPRALAFAVILMFAMPAPYILPIYAGSEAEQQAAATMLSLNTLATIAMFAVVAAVA